MVDLFDEVEEQLRSDRYKTLALKLAPWVIGALIAGLLVAGAVWGWRTYTARVTAEASDTYASALETLGAGRQEEAYAQFGKVAGSQAKGYASLALMQQGGIRLGQNRTAEAVKLFDEAAKRATSPLVQDAARLKSALALLDTAPYADMEARLKPMLEDGRPYRVQAREALAFAKLLKGDTAGAREEFVVISLLSDAPEGARQRASAAMQLIDSGSAASIAAAVKAAAALPPAAPSPSLPQQPQAPVSQ